MTGIFSEMAARYALASRLSGFADWYAWWHDEMRGLFGMDRHDTAGSKTILEVSRNGVRVLGDASDEGAMFPDLESCIVHLRAGSAIPKGMILALDGTQCLVRSLSQTILPASLANNAARIDCQANTPFRAEDVHLVAGPSSDGSGMVYAIVRRPVFNSLVHGLTANEVNVERIRFLGSKQVLDLDAARLPWLKSDGLRRLRQVTNGALIVSGLAFLFAGAVILDQKLDAAELSIEQQIAMVEPAANKARKVISDLKAHNASMQSIRDAIRREPARLAVIADLTEALPNTTHLSDLTMDGATITMVGQAPEPADLIPELERHASFASVKFNEAIIKVPGLEGRRFNLSLELADP